MLNCDDRCNFFWGGDTSFEICALFVSLRLSLGSPPGSALHSNKLGWNGGGEGGEDGVDSWILDIHQFCPENSHRLDPNITKSKVQVGCITQNIKVLVKSKKCNAICVKKKLSQREYCVHQTAVCQ